MAKFESLTKYLVLIENDAFGQWVFDCNSKGTLDDPIEMPYISYSDMVCEFENAVYAIKDQYEELNLVAYHQILATNGIDLTKESMSDVDVANMDVQCVLAMLMAAVRNERFCEGTLLRLFKNGAIMKWLVKLEELDHSGDLAE